MVHSNSVSVLVSTWVSMLDCEPFDIAARIRIGDDAQQAGYQDPSGYIPPGQTAPTIIFEEGVTDFGVLVLDANDEWTGDYTDWQPIRLSSSDMSQPVYFDIGIYQETSPGSGEYEFVPLATATETLGNLWGTHTYEAGTLAPPSQTAWKPTDYYYEVLPVPEPSTAALTMAGLALLFRRRRGVRPKKS